MKKTKNTIIAIMIPITALFLPSLAISQPSVHGPHIVTDIKAERIKFTNDTIKISWKMDKKYSGDFIVGRSENEIKSTEDALQAKLVGIFNSAQDGILIDRDTLKGKKYYYLIVSKDLLLKRKIDIIKNSNYTSEPVSIFIEPEPVQSLRADASDANTILLKWGKSKGDNFKYNVYRSKSAISSGAELEVAERISTLDKNDFEDRNVTDYGSYFYAVSVSDKNGIEYFTPKPDQNYTTNGIYLKEKTLSTPLNVGSFLIDKNSVIVKWSQSQSRSGKDLQGYEIYRSEELINSLLKLKFSKLIQIADSSATQHTDRSLPPGKYYYAVFSRYSDGTIDINFDSDSNYTKTPILITEAYKITSTSHELAGNRIVLKWDYTGNTGSETVSIFKSSKIPPDSSGINEDDIIGTENIKSGKFIINKPPPGIFYFGVLCRNDNETVNIAKGVNITINSIDSGTDKLVEKKEPIAKKPDKKTDKTTESRDDFNIQNKTLNGIIHNRFYKGEYSSAIKELEYFIRTSDNKYDRNKARLFIARSYIELNDYARSIILLNDDELKKEFPEETRFWLNFALVRIK